MRRGNSQLVALAMVFGVSAVAMPAGASNGKCGTSSAIPVGLTSNVRLIGEGPMQQAIRVTETVPLALGLEMLTPNNWVVCWNPEISMTTQIGWATPQPLTAALQNIGKRRSLRFTLDYNERAIHVDPMPQIIGRPRLAERRAALNTDNTPPLNDAQQRQTVATRSVDQMETNNYEDMASLGPIEHDSPSVYAADLSDTSDKPSVADYSELASTSNYADLYLSNMNTPPEDVPATVEDVTVTAKAAELEAAPTYPVEPSQPAERTDFGLADLGYTAEWGLQYPWFEREFWDSPSIVQHAGTRPRRASMTLTEFYAELVVLDLQNVRIKEAIQRIAPAGWNVEVATPAGFFNGKVIKRLIAERPRGEVIADLQRQLGIKILPYTIQNLLVVTKR